MNWNLIGAIVCVTVVVVGIIWLVAKDKIKAIFKKK